MRWLLLAVFTVGIAIAPSRLPGETLVRTPPSRSRAEPPALRFPMAATSWEPPPAGEPIPWAGPRPGCERVKVRVSASAAAATLGEFLRRSAVPLAPGARVPLGHGCSRWLAVHPAGYVCADEVRVWSAPYQPDPSPRPRYRYGVIDRGPHRGDGVTITGASGGLLRTSAHGLLRVADVRFEGPPRQHALDLTELSGQDLERLAFLLPAYTVVEVLSLSGAATAWVRARGEGGSREVPVTSLRRLPAGHMPADLAPGERWIDISLSEQVLVAYEGRAPVLATLVSTSDHETPPGEFRIARKYREQRMANRSGAASRYDYLEVPHAQFFAGRIGLHAVLWHDRLGQAVSHGCINLSPADAERLFDFTQPALPPGWHVMNALQAGPMLLAGTRVVVHQ